MQPKSVLSLLLSGIDGKRDPEARRVVEYLARRGGVCRESADQVARRVGARDRFALAHRLQRAGLPTLSRLKDLVWLESCVVRWRTSGISLRAQALAARAKPKRWYQKVKKVSGRSWTEIRDSVTAWIVEAIELSAPVRRSGKS